MKKPHIEIEQMLFGDLRVQVWDENLQSLLDREYFVRGDMAALYTAMAIRDLNEKWKDLKIFYRSGDKIEELPI